MQLKARVINKIPIATGTSQSGYNWSTATLIVKTIGQNPKKVALTNMKRAEEFNNLPVGTTATFDIEVESREFNGKWYSDINCYNWNID